MLIQHICRRYIMTFNEIMEYCPRNLRVYKEIKQDFRQLTPFVGAGLSAFCYPTWASALSQLSSNITDIDKKQQIKDLISKSSLFEAADELEDYFTEFNLKYDLLELFHENKLKLHEKELSSQAVYDLAVLFPTSSVITTNFDRVLEHTYAKVVHPFDFVVGPKSKNLLNDMRQANKHSLFKVHGDIGGAQLDYGSIIFSKKQYLKHYSNESTLVKELSDWLRGRMMFFVGCSLEDDYPLQLLYSIVGGDSYQDGYCHYAIVPCKKENIDIRTKYLGNHHIRAIFYPEGEWDSVQIILQRLYFELIFPEQFNEATMLINWCQSEEDHSDEVDRLHKIYLANQKNVHFAVLFGQALLVDMETEMDNIIAHPENSDTTHIESLHNRIQQLYDQFQDDIDMQIVYATCLHYRLMSLPSSKRADVMNLYQNLVDDSSENPIIHALFLQSKIIICEMASEAEELREQLHALWVSDCPPEVVQIIYEVEQYLEFRFPYDYINFD